MFKLAAIIVGSVIAIGATLHVLGVFGTVATAPGRVINKTLDTGNIISSYEWFYDTNAQYDSRVNQIKGHFKLLQYTTDAKERSNINIELSAIRQSCRDLVTKYNANSEKVNKSIFKSGDLPEVLNIKKCED